MSTDEIRQSIEKAAEYLKQNPEEARYTDSLATAVIEEDLRCRIEDPDGREIVSDMPTSVGGADSAPSPGWLLRAAEASCVATLVAMRAAQVGLELDEIQVLVDSESNDYGILGLDESVPVGPIKTSVRVRITGIEGQEGRIREVVEWAVEHCPVTDAVRRSVPLETEIEVS